jgi:hypothetical protein
MPVLLAIQRLLDDERERREQKKEDAEVERGEADVWGGKLDPPQSPAEDR